MPYKKEINNINININGYNIHGIHAGGALTSRTSNNPSKKKSKTKNNIKDILNKNNKQNTLMSKKEGNPVRIKKIYENIKNNNIYNNKSLAMPNKKKK